MVVGSIFRSAASRVVIQSGRHFVRFTVVGGDPLLGVIRPGYVVGGVNTPSTTQAAGDASQTSATRRGCRTRWSRATASECC